MHGVILQERLLRFEIDQGDVGLGVHFERKSPETVLFFFFFLYLYL